MVLGGARAKLIFWRGGRSVNMSGLLLTSVMAKHLQVSVGLGRAFLSGQALTGHGGVAGPHHSTPEPHSLPGPGSDPDGPLFRGWAHVQPDQGLPGAVHHGQPVLPRGPGAFRPDVQRLLLRHQRRGRGREGHQPEGDDASRVAVQDSGIETKSFTCMVAPR